MFAFILVAATYSDNFFCKIPTPCKVLQTNVYAAKNVSYDVLNRHDFTVHLLDTFYNYYVMLALK